MIDDETKINAECCEPDGLYLFNHTIPMNVDSLAFVGAQLSACKLGGYASVRAAKLIQVENNWIPNTKLLHQIHFYDLLMKDMGMLWKRRGLHLPLFAARFTYSIW
jgi:hypothetical protein